MAWPTKAEKEAKRLAEQQPTADAASLNMETVAALIKDAVAASVASLRDELRDMRDATPRVQAREAPVDVNASRREAIAELVKGQQAGGILSQIPTDYRGQPAAGRGQPRFHARDQVRLRPEISREGFPKAGDPFPVKYDIDLRGRRRVSRDWAMFSRMFQEMPEENGVFPRDVTWGDICKANRCSGVGIVARVGDMSRVGVWKYRVSIPGLTQESGDSVYEYELEEAV